jgi:hypothetical protein
MSLKAPVKSTQTINSLIQAGWVYDPPCLFVNYASFIILNGES